MHRILLRHTYVVIFLKLFSLIGSFGRTDKVNPVYPPPTSLGGGYKNSI